MFSIYTLILRTKSFYILFDTKSIHFGPCLILKIFKKEIVVVTGNVNTTILCSLEFTPSGFHTATITSISLIPVFFSESNGNKMSAKLKMYMYTILLPWHDEMIVFHVALPVRNQLIKGSEGPPSHLRVAVHHTTLGAVYPCYVLDIVWIRTTLTAILKAFKIRILKSRHGSTNELGPNMKHWEWKESKHSANYVTEFLFQYITLI